MNKRVEKRIDELLDGELEPDERRACEEEIEAEQGAGGRLDRDRALLAALAALPKHPPRRDLVASVSSQLMVPRTPLGLPATPAAKAAWVTGASVATAAAVIGTILVLTHEPSRPQPEPPEPRSVPVVCTVARVEGSVSRTHQGRTVAAVAGDRIRPEESVRTGFDGQAALEVGPGVEAVLGRASRAAIERLEAAERRLLLADGRLAVTTPAATGETVLVRAGPAVISATSGTLAVLVADGERVAVAAVDGSARLTTASGAVEIGAGQLVELRGPKVSGGPRAPPAKVPLGLTGPATCVRRGRLELAGRTGSHVRLWLERRRLPVGPDGRFRVELDVACGQRIELLAEDVLGRTRRLQIGPLQRCGPGPKGKQPEGRKRPEPPPEAESYKITW